MRHPTFSAGLAADIIGLLATSPRSVFELARLTGDPLDEIGQVCAALCRAGSVRIVADEETGSESLLYLSGEVRR